jgi:hypothetical protein
MISKASAKTEVFAILSVDRIALIGLVLIAHSFHLRFSWNRIPSSRGADAQQENFPSPNILGHGFGRRVTRSGDGSAILLLLCYDYSPDRATTREKKALHGLATQGRCVWGVQGAKDSRQKAIARAEDRLCLGRRLTS